LSGLVKREHEKNDHQTRIAITGLGGLGKSELCLNLIEKVREKYRTP
jgi:nucleoside-triphosphatase THEP1